MKAREFDQKFDDGEDVTQFLDLSKAQRPLFAQRTVSIDLPTWMIESLDREAHSLGVTPESIIQATLAQHLEIHNPI